MVNRIRGPGAAFERALRCQRNAQGSTRLKDGRGVAVGLAFLPPRWRGARQQQLKGAGNRVCRQALRLASALGIGRHRGSKLSASFAATSTASNIAMPNQPVRLGIFAAALVREEQRLDGDEAKTPPPITCMYSSGS